MRSITVFFVVLLAGLGQAGLSARALGATLFVNDLEVVTLKTGGGGFTPSDRAALAAKALSTSNSIEVTFRLDGGYGFVRIGDAKVLSVDSAEARAHSMSVSSLTKEIAANLRKAIESVPFVLSSKKVWLPIGGTAQVQLIGPAASKIALTYDSSQAVRTTHKDGTITFHGESVGESRVNVSYGKKVETVIVNVLLPAATISGPVTASVSGRPADKGTVANAAQRAVLSALSAPLDAEVTVEALNAPELVPAQRGAMKVRATVRAPGRYPFEQDIVVEIKNEGMLDTVSEELWYSNHPETVLRPSKLYWGRLREGKAARVLYHHLNAASTKLEIKYVLVNTSDEPASVAFVQGDALPHTNPTYAGYMAGEQFFPRWVRGSASVIEIPPHSVVPVVWETLMIGETASGLLAMHAIRGNALFIGNAYQNTYDRPAGNFAFQMPTTSLADVPMNLVGQTQHVYSPAEKSLAVNYEVGKRWGYIRIGEQPVGRLDTEGKLSGNFGIVYKIEATVTNPTSEAADIEFVFESSAGYTGAFFRINGLVYRTPLLQPKKTHRFHRISLEPGETKTYYMETMPLSGGSYPCTVTIKPVGVG